MNTPANGTRPAAIIVALTVAAAVPCAVRNIGETAQLTTPLDASSGGNDLRFSISAGYQGLFETDIDGGGDFSVDRVGLELNAQTEIAADWRLDLNLRYLFDDYDFSNAVKLGGDPWSDITTLEMDARFQWWVNSDLAVIFGPFVMWSRESGASWNDAVTGGGFAGVLIRSGDNLAWGGGIGVSSQLEDSVLVYPVLFLDWTITDDMKLTSVAGPVGLAFTGLEFVWAFAEQYEAAAGFRYEFRRFRLDDAGVAPGGVGEDSSFPMWVRLSYRFNDRISADLYAGFVAGTSFELDNSRGRRLGSDDTDLAPTVAFTVRVNF